MWSDFVTGVRARTGVRVWVWRSCRKADGLVVAFRRVRTDVDCAFVQVTTTGLYRIAIGCLIRHGRYSGIAVRLVHYCGLFRLRRAVRAIVFGDRGDSTGLQCQTDPHSGKQAE